MTDTDVPSRTGIARRLGLVWLPVIGVEILPLPNFWLLALVVPLLEAAAWLVAVGITMAVVWRRGRAVRITVAALLVAAAVWFNNWSVFEPRSYFVIHRPAFDTVADVVRTGVVRDGGTGFNEVPLPPHLTDLSTTGQAVVVGTDDGRPIVLLPQWFGLLDGATGFVYFDGEPGAGTVANLYDDPACVCDGMRLGGGWWYL